MIGYKEGEEQVRYELFWQVWEQVNGQILKQVEWQSKREVWHTIDGQIVKRVRLLLETEL